MVKQQFKGGVKLVPGPELDPGVDVVIGPEIQGLRPDAPDSLTLTKATTVCSKFTTKPTGG